MDGEVRSNGRGVIHGRASGARGEDRRRIGRSRAGRRLREAAQKALGEKASVARSQPYYLDVTHPPSQQGRGRGHLSKRLNIPPGQIATIGDMPNDVLMFRKSGFSIAMGNASDEVKAQASAVTESNENEGFAKAVRKLSSAQLTLAPSMKEHMMQPDSQHQRVWPQPSLTLWPRR